MKNAGPLRSSRKRPFCSLFAVSLVCLASAVKILAAEPAGMCKIRPEYIAAILRKQAAASAFITANSHFMLTGIFFPSDRIPLAMFGIVRASADRTYLAFLASPARRTITAITFAAVAAWDTVTAAALIVATTSHSSITPLLYE